MKVWNSQGGGDSVTHHALVLKESKVTRSTLWEMRNRLTELEPLVALA